MPTIEQRLASVETAHAREDRRMLLVAEGSTRDHDEYQAEQGTRKRAYGSVVHAFVDKAEARSKHESGRDGVGGSEPPACGMLRESEGHGAQPCGHRREQREEKDRSYAHRFHALYSPRSRRCLRDRTLKPRAVDRPAPGPRPP